MSVAGVAVKGEQGYLFTHDRPIVQMSSAGVKIAGLGSVHPGGQNENCCLIPFFPTLNRTPLA